MNEQTESIHIEWVEGPPPATGGKGSGVWVSRLAEMATRPGEWAKFPGIKWATITSTIRATATKHGHNVEAVSRVQPDGTYTIYVRVIA